MEEHEVQMMPLEQQKGEFYETLQKIFKKESPDANIEKAKAMLKNNPDVWKKYVGLSYSTMRKFLAVFGEEKGNQLLIEAEVLSIRNGLGYASASQLERLIIDQIMLCWARINHAEYMVVIMVLENYSYYKRDHLEYWQNRLIFYQNSYLKAIETLARVRRLSKGVAFQVNIATDGGQQVNVNEVKKEE
ncbi:MAG: hypothetical protein ABH882_01420 [Candidatus Omnitrophota bacterium]|nr:hypothetical protein [Candidatus Omnitrophota bacterium]